MCQMQSEQIDQIAAALAKAQAELRPAAKNGENPHLKNRYSDIAAVYEAIRDVLPHHGLAVAQMMLPRDDGKAHVRTLLMHTSGQWLAGECVMPCQQQGPQGTGSAITYARRYSLSAMVGVVSEDDDDGEGATRRGSQPARKQPAGKGSTGRKPAAPPTYDLAHIASDMATKCSTPDELKVYFASLCVPDAHPQRQAIIDLMVDAKAALDARKADEPAQDGAALITPAQLKALQAHYSRLGYDRDQRLTHMTAYFGHPVDSSKNLTKDEASQLLDDFNRQAPPQDERPADYPF